MKKLVSIVICILMISSVAYANTVEPSFSPDDFSLKVEGTLGTKAGELFTLNIVDNANPLSDGNIPFYSSPYITGSNGRFSTSILLPLNIASGKWYVKLGSGVATASNSFIIVNPNDTNTQRVLASIKSSGDTSSLYNTLNANSAGVDDINYVGFEKMQNLSAICDVLYYELKNSNDNVQSININDFYHAFRRVLFFTDLKNGFNFDTAVENYADSMAVSSGEYVSLSADVKTSFTNIFTSSDYTIKSLQELFTDSMFFVKLKSAESIGDCETLIKENAAFLGIDMGSGSEYQKIAENKRYKVFQKIYESKGSLNKTTQVKSLFDTTVTDVLNTPVTSNPSSSPSISSPSSTVVVDTNYTQDMPVTIPPESLPIFDDIAESFAKEQIEALAKDGIISGYTDGSFKPQNNVSRAEFVTLVVRALGIEQGTELVAFDDVRADEWYYDTVEKMASNSYISGYNGSFNPDGNITRQDAAVIIYNVISSNLNIDTALDYSDFSEISSYAANAVNAISSAKIMQGYENKFRPVDYITRAETAVLISNVLDFLNK